MDAKASQESTSHLY